LTSIVTVAVAATASEAAAPGWSRGQQDLAVSYDECRARSTAALKAEGYKIDYDAGAFSVGIKDPHTAVISCHPIAAGKTAVNIVVASNGPGGGEERVRLQTAMEKRPATGGGGGGGDEGWTAWMSRDDPGASADWEALAEVKASVPCDRPVAIECRTVKDKIDWRQTGQRYTCSLEGANPGGICINADNAPSGCLDYEVRYRCPAR